MYRDTANTLVDLLRSRCTAEPDTLMFTFEGKSGRVDEITVHQLDRRARALAARLQASGMTGEPVLIVQPPGVGFIVAFLSCLYAGAIAVPVYPPIPNRLQRTLPRFVSIAEDARVKGVIANEEILGMMALVGPLLGELAELPRFDVAQLDAGLEHLWRHPGSDADAVAFLQYTSGSTGDPKGVMITHGNLLDNARAMNRAFDVRPGDVAVCWLPPYHDMGLIGGILAPIYAGMQVHLLDTMAFLRRPVRWLEMISERRASFTGGPNFAYDLCARKVTDDEIARLDLSSWKAAFSGAEPVRARTMRAFARRFEACHFDATAFCPCYGMAENTLLISSSEHGQRPRTCALEAEALARGDRSALHVRDLNDGPEAERLEVTSCGLAACDLLVVDPDTRRVVGEGQPGELWLAGGSVARGYWRREAETAAIFGARAIHADGRETGPYLRTGDLGFTLEGRVFVMGRQKDLMIFNGRNYHPHDIESLIEEAHPDVRKGCAAAFSLELDDAEALALVVEVAAEAPEGPVVAGAISKAVATECGVQPVRIVLIRAGDISKTSSGKIQRRQTRQRLLSSDLDVVYDWRAPMAQVAEAR